MKFDVIGALARARNELAPSEVRINCYHSPYGFVVQLKVLGPDNQVFGQEFVIGEKLIQNNDTWYSNDEFTKAVTLLKLQIEEASDDNSSV